MKHKLQIILCASAGFFLEFSAPAQDASHYKTSGQNYAVHQVASANQQNVLTDTAKASDILGMTVKNYQNEKLGTVADLAVDMKSGRIVEVILSCGGVPGWNNEFAAVPPEVLHQAAGHKVLQMDSSVAIINAAPKFDPAHWNQCTQSNRVTDVYGYYGIHLYFVADHGEYRTTSVDGITASSLPRNMDGTINPTGGRTLDRIRNEEIASDLEETNNPTLTQYPVGTWTTNHLTHNDGATTSWSSLVYVQQASKLMGTPVVNLQDEKLGKVENMMVDLPAGRIVAVIISSARFIGPGGELSAVRTTALTFNAEQYTLQLDASKEMLASFPHVRASERPDFRQSVFADGVYPPYNAGPFVATHVATDAGNSQADVATTAEIRKEIIADNDMSTNAKNVQISTTGGHVTLRGPVNSARERRLIGEIADRIAQAANVDNQLAVLMTTSSNN